MRLSDRMKNMKASPTLALANRARELAALGHPVISLTVGEPDWPTLKSAAAGGQAAIVSGQTKYTAAQGTIELRRAILPWLKEETGIQYQDNEVVVGSGGKFVLAAAFQALVQSGDEVLISSPYWVSYPVMAELAGAKPVVIDCGKEQNFKLTATQLQKNINSRTRILVLCSPSNPTGLVYSEDELKSLAKVILQFPELLVISDDIYTRLMLNGDKTAPHILKVEPRLRDQVICVNGASKAFAMTGWRIGWAAGPAVIMKAMADYFSQTTSNPSSISQAAALAALNEGAEEMLQNTKTLMQRMNLGLESLKRVPGLKAIRPEGAFYFWVDISAWIGKRDLLSGQTLTSSKEICEILLEKYFVATVPGEEFGAPGFLRLSFAVATDKFSQACDRLAQLAKSL